MTIMVVAILYGAGSGALHAVTGPDHVLSLGPVALERRRGSWRIGLAWGAGHALGTVLLALPVLCLSRVVSLPSVASFGDRLAGLALLLTAVWSFRSLRRGAKETRGETRNPLLVGLVHGSTGAGSLLLVLPVLVSGSLVRTLLFLAAFSVGSTVAMAGLTDAIARVGAKLDARVVERSQRALAFASLVLGAFWLLT